MEEILVMKDTKSSKKTEIDKVKESDVKDVNSTPDNHITEDNKKTIKKKDKTTKDGQSKKTEKRLLYVLAFAIPFAVALIALAMGGFAPFGDKDVLTTGGFEKYRYFLNDLHDKVNEGTTNTSGLVSAQGYDTTSSWAYYLSDPTNLITLLFSKDSMADVLNLLYALKLGLAGLFFSFFLSYRRRISAEKKLLMEGERADIITTYREKIAAKKKAKLVAKSGARNAKNQQFDVKLGGTDDPEGGALLFLKKFDVITLALSVTYALSAYMLGSGLNVTWLGAVAVFPLVMLGIDKLVNEKKWLFYTLSLAVSFYMNFYITIIVFIFTFVYFFLQDYRDTRHIVTTTLYKIMSDILAIGTASLVVVTSMRSSLMSNMLSLEFPRPERSVKIFDVIKYQLAGVKPDAATKGTDGVMIYAGVFVLLLLFMYVQNGNINLNTRIRNIALTAVLYIATFQTTLNYLFNGFYYTRTNSTVFGFILIFMLLQITESVLTNIEHQRGTTVTVSFIILLGLIFASLSLSSNYTTMSPFMTSLELAALYFFIVILYRNDSMTHILFKTVFGLSVIAEIAVSFVNGLSSSGNKSKTYAETDVARYEAAEDHIHEIDSNAKVDVFVEGESSQNPVTNMLSGIDYVIALEGSEHIVDYLDYQESYDGIDIYKNTYVIDNGFYVSSEIESLYFDEDQFFRSLNILTNCLTGVDVFDTLSGDFSAEDIFNVIGGEYIKTRNKRLIFDTPESGNLYSSIMGDVISLGYCSEGTTMTYVFKPHTKPSLFREAHCSYANLNTNNFEQLYENLQNNSISYTPNSDISVSYDAVSSGFMAIPVDSIADYDITDAKYINILGTTYVLIPVEAGINTINYKHHDNISFISIIILVLSVLSIISLYLVFNKHLEKQDSDKASFSRLCSFVYNYKVYILSITITSMVFCIMLFARSTTPFGNALFLTNDGIAQTYPIVTGTIKNLFSGNLTLMNYHIGAGIDNYISNLPGIITPVYYLVALFSTSDMPLCFTIINYLLFIMPGCAIIIYLTHRPSGKRLEKTNILLLPFALSYNLSAFIISYISHVSFVQLAIIFPIFMLAFERLIYNKKYIMYILVLTYMMFWGTFYAFITAEFTILYYLCFDFKNIKDFVNKSLRALIYSIISAGLAAVMLVPYYISTLSSPYKGRDYTIPELGLTSDFIKIFDHLKSGAPVVMITEDFWRANVYCGLLLTLMIPIYLFKKQIKLSVRIRKTILVLLLFISFGSPFLNYVFHGFHQQAKVPNRFSLFVIFLLLTMAYDVVTDIGSRLCINYKQLISTSALGVLLSAIFIINGNGKLTSTTMISIIVIVSYLILMLLSTKQSIKLPYKKVFSLILIAELLFSTFHFSIFNILGTQVTTENESYIIGSDIVKDYSLNRYHNRTAYIDGFENSSMFLDTESPAAFHPNMTVNNIDFIGYNGIGVHEVTNFIVYSLTNPMADIFLNVKYHFINEYYEDNYTYSYMQEKVSVSNISLYENPYAVSFGFFIDKDSIFNKQNDLSLFREYDFDDLLGLQNIVSENMTGSKLYDLIKLETDESKITESSSYILLNDSEFDDPSIVDPTAHVKVVLGNDITGDIYISFGFFTYLTNKETTGVKEIYFDLDADRYYEYSGSTFYLAKLNEDTLSKMHEILSVAPLTDINDTFNTISGNINAPSDGTVYISLPYQDGWTATVDGKDVEIVEFLEGIGIPVSAGQHKITISYMTPGLKAGGLISLITLILFIGFIIFDRKVLSKRKNDEDKSADDESVEGESIEGESVKGESVDCNSDDSASEAAEVSNEA